MRPARSGFVLVGGASSRMGRDKALLPHRGTTLVEHVAAEVREAAGSVVLVGPPERYQSLGLPVLEDTRPGLGPLAGIATALASTAGGWSLIVACDMPAVTAQFLTELIEKAEASSFDCILPAGVDRRLEPLCAAYHRRCLPVIEAALERGVRKVTAGLAGLDLHLWPCHDSDIFRNVNTPADWQV